MRWTKETPCPTPGCNYIHPVSVAFHPLEHRDHVPLACPVCGVEQLIELHTMDHSPTEEEAGYMITCRHCGHTLDECVCPEHPDRMQAATVEGARGDWQCPYCDHLNSHLNRYCQECGELYGTGVEG